MKYKKYKLNNYNLYTVKTDRFKTINIKINIRVKSEKEDEKYYPMLWRMLSRTSKYHSSIKEINRACVKIYDPSYSIKVMESGKEDILLLSASFINEKYTENGMNEESIKFLLPFIFEPKIINNAFDEEIFKNEKETLIDNYKEIKDHPRKYVSGKIEYLLESRGYKTYSLEELIEETKKITSKELYEFYLKVMSKGKLDIFVCGNIDPEEMKNIFEKHINFKGERKGKINHIVNPKASKKIKIVEEESHNIQTNLAIGCKTIDLTTYERNYVLSAYSHILGGSMNSLLHQTVREKNSLCYYIYSNYTLLEGTLKIYTGIDYKDFNKVYDLIKKEMDNIIKGNFNHKLIDNYKQIYLSSLKSIEDYENDTIGNYISEIFIGTDNIENKRKNVEKLTKEDIMNLAKKIQIDTVFVLKGDEHE